MHERPSRSILNKIFVGVAFTMKGENQMRAIATNLPLPIARAVHRYCQSHATTMVDLLARGLARELETRGQDELAAMVADRGVRQYEKTIW